jgi:hypothetical protein
MFLLALRCALALIRLAATRLGGDVAHPLLSVGLATPSKRLGARFRGPRAAAFSSLLASASRIAETASTPGVFATAGAALFDRAVSVPPDT